ncbi:MAG: ABC transporter ATP-binding protein [Candidatus Heimdallarchaeota archaeon]|nr:ABC transporter ATP-binding protein [Candidatus Heimdallarchaeota archaeon]MCK5048082.1 ABC transporter ATP-binding protein [Candidatus Heimdallarchaeota archaeon]
MVDLELKDVTKYFDESFTLKPTSFQVPSGKIGSLLGPSGSGKTTLLRIIAGLQKVDSGMIFFDNYDVTDLPPEKREIGLVSQDGGLFPHMSVSKNIGFGLETKKMARERKKTIVKEMIELVGLQGYENHLPREISGGQRQRVALARSLAPDPKLILLDEPLSSLDTMLKVTLREEILRIQKETGKTMIVVSHDKSTILSLTDYVGVLNNGEMLQFGAVEEVMMKPVSNLVTSFMERTNVVPSEIILEEERITLITVLGKISFTSFGAWKAITSIMQAKNKRMVQGEILLPPDALKQIKNEEIMNEKALALVFEGKVNFTNFQGVTTLVNVTSQKLELAYLKVLDFKLNPKKQVSEERVKLEIKLEEIIPLNFEI